MANDNINFQLQNIFKKYEELIDVTPREVLYQYIKSCLKENASLSITENFNTNGCSFKKFFKYLSRTVLIFLLILVCMITVFIEFNKFIENDDNHNFVFRSRNIVLSLGLQKFEFIQNLYEPSCLLTNPFSKSDSSKCFCQFDLVKHTINDSEKAQNNFLKKFNHAKINPFLVINAFSKEVDFSDLSTLYWKNREDILSGYTNINNFGVSVSQSHLDDLFMQKAPPSEENIEWYFRHVNAIHHFRSLFPRLNFIPLSKEISLMRQIFVHGQNAPNISIEIPFRDTTRAKYYIQAFGERNITIHNSKKCNCHSESQSVVLHPKEVLVIPSDFFYITSSPTNAAGYSVGYVGGVYM